MESKDQNNHLGSWIVIGFFGFASLFIVVLAWWWFFFHTPTAPPSNVKARYTGAESRDKYIFSFSWENNNSWPTTFSYELKDQNNKTVASGQTSGMSWDSPGLENGVYTFTISSQASTWFSPKTSSGNVTIELTVSNPTLAVGQEEVFAVMGMNSSGGKEYFSTEQDAKKVCKVLGYELATDIQLAEAFNDGADWWAYTWYEKTLSSPKSLDSGYPCWNQSQMCSYNGETKAQIVNGAGGTPGGTLISGVACWGVKPEQNKNLDIPAKLIDNPEALTFSALAFSECQGRYYQRDIPSENLCVCDLNTCSS